MYEYVFVDYTQEETLDPSRPLSIWGSQFNQWVQSFGEDRKRFLVGYSLGGRLALHALQNQPDLWDKAVLISTHPGFLAEEQRTARLKTDKLFAKRIAKERWEKVLESWNGQFQDRQKEPPRGESEVPREVLSAALQNWSLGAQYDFRETLVKSKIPQLWVAGEYDSKFREVFDGVPGTVNLLKTVIPESSHRVIFEQPHALKSIIESFLE